MLRLKLLTLIVVLTGAALLEMLSCNSSSTQKDSSGNTTYRNLSDSAAYVGMETCRSCHANVYATFIQTGMGESWDHATKKKSSGRFDAHSYVYDKYKNFWYHPFWSNDSLYIKEFRLQGKDTVYQRTEKISYVVGSGQHTNSHIWMENGYLFQAPMTFYTQKGIWGLPPGFDEGMNTRWSRTVSVECMNCHNMYPQFDASSVRRTPFGENKFLSVKTGIECERCHGPGSIHVKEKMAGVYVDTSKEIDYSIVNPKKLPRDLQVELCQRCHLQGISVLNEGKTFFDFKPGMKLSEVENVFMPRYEGNPNKFIMASHADRMKQSRCYQSSNMTCLTCHNPHVSVTVTPPGHFNSTCKSCHNTATKDCTLPLAERLKEDNNCFKCHMPVSETLDIPNVTVHDHRIQVPVSKAKQDEIMKFVGLECMTTKTPSPLLMAQGYLQTYEAYSPQPFLLDSAAKYISEVSDHSDIRTLKAEVRLAFLRENYTGVIELSSHLNNNEADDWTLYRIGESYYQSSDYKNAFLYFSKAVSKDSLNTEFLNKRGSAALALGQTEVAKQCFRQCMAENPKYAPAINNLGYVSFTAGDLAYANTLFDKALSLDPDYEQALMNKAALLFSQRKNDEAKKFITRVLTINPKNEKAKQVMQHFPVNDRE